MQCSKLRPDHNKFTIIHRKSVLIDQGRILGKVTDLSGNPIVDAAVCIVGNAPVHPDIAVLTDQDGCYQIDLLSDGKYTVMVNAEGRRPLVSEVEVEGNCATSLDFVLPY